MEILFDFELTNGELVTGVYFLQYQRPIKIGKSRSIAMWANDCLKCFNSNDEEIRDKDFNEAIMLRAYDKETGNDVTEFYGFFIAAKNNLGTRGMSDRNPFARDVVKIDD